MKWYLRDHTSHLPVLLEQFKQRHVQPYTLTLLEEKVTRIPLNASLPLPETLPECLRNYRIFPEYIMRACTQWDMENRELQTGDTIVQQVRFPASRLISVKLVFGVRICEIIDTPDRKGFSYETLTGHAENGKSTFVLERRNNQLYFCIHTWSAPGNRLTRFTKWFLTRPFQSYCTRAALTHVAGQLHDRV